MKRFLLFISLILILLCMLALGGTRLLGPGNSSYHLVIVGYYVMTAVTCLLCLIIIRDILFLGYHTGSMIREKSLESKRVKLLEEDQKDAASEVQTQIYGVMSRRAFLGRAGSFAVLGATALATPAEVYAARCDRKIRTTNIKFSKLPSAFEGLRIAHLSDIHVGNTITRDDIQKMVDETNALEPDIIVITGDIGDGMPELVASGLEPMRDFKSKYGVYYVTGNHEHMWDAKGWCDAVEALGIHVLNNEHQYIQNSGAKIAICGAIDYRGDHRDRSWKSDPAKALSGIPDEIFKIMLVHQPASVDISFENHADLVLLGHTHGGQFWPACYLVDAIHKYSRGLYYHGSQAAYVSCGTGYWGPPLRFGVPCEICLHILNKAD